MSEYLLGGGILSFSLIRADKKSPFLPLDITKDYGFSR